MAKAATRFYNMLVHLIRNNKLFEENVAIKNVWQKEGNTFLDIYFYRNRKSYVFDALFVHDILDLTNEKYYKDIESFVADFRETAAAPEEEAAEPVLVIDKSLFQPVYVDLVIINFIAACGQDFSVIKKRIILNYIKEKLPSTANLSRQYIETYIDSLKPSEQDFYQALNELSAKRQDEVEHLSRELLKVCLADGSLTYLEKMYLAEFLQVLREQGVKVDLGL